ncbi:MAG: hypothetical protein D6769_01615 [Methanobacteriota archaeon]|nr:MAG: hypothetical protein D6769_01615 [Euryarchaeota archaeon]
MLLFALAFIVAYGISYLSTKRVIAWEKKSGLVSRDMHKESPREVAHTAGPAIIFGVVAGVLVGVAYTIFVGNGLDITDVFAGLASLIIISYIGLVDDLFVLEQYWKPLLPIIAAIPLIATNMGDPTITLPFLGVMNVGLLYPLVLVPLGIIVASNVTNMLAGFNGLEAGMGIVMFAALTVVGVANNSEGMLAFSMPMLGALLAFYAFNKYPAKIFPGDSTNYLIGAGVAISVIVGNYESVGAILMIPYGVDAILKAINKFPKTFVKLRGGKLTAPTKVRGLIDLVLKITGPIEEKKLSYVFMGIELVFALIAIGVGLRFF